MWCTEYRKMIQFLLYSTQSTTLTLNAPSLDSCWQAWWGPAAWPCPTWSCLLHSAAHPPLLAPALGTFATVPQQNLLSCLKFWTQFIFPIQNSLCLFLQQILLQHNVLQPFCLGYTCKFSELPAPQPHIHTQEEQHQGVRIGFFLPLFPSRA